jgi:hypothetical protein
MMVICFYDGHFMSIIHFSWEIEALTQILHLTFE